MQFCILVKMLRFLTNEVEQSKNFLFFDILLQQLHVKQPYTLVGRCTVALNKEELAKYTSRSFTLIEFITQNRWNTSIVDINYISNFMFRLHYLPSYTHVFTLFTILHALYVLFYTYFIYYFTRTLFSILHVRF